MKIKMISTEIIKPSSPTPPHLKTHQLFYSNQFAPDDYFPLILFYSSPQSQNEFLVSTDHLLKTSLSKTLTYYYPLAGQIIDGVSTDCDDRGAVFIETQIPNKVMSDFLQIPDGNLLKHLLPFNGDLQEISTTYQAANLVIQVNNFGCGGKAISICFRHLIADASTAGNFVKTWAEVSRGADGIKDVIVDYTSIPRLYESIAVVKSVYQQQRQHVSKFPSERVIKKLVFYGEKIPALREKIGNGPYLDRPTRFEAISALILGAFMAINVSTEEETDELKATKLAAVIAINLRNKTNPPLPPQCIGNLVTATIANLPMEKKTIDYNEIAGKLRESVRKVVDEYKKVKEHGHGGEVVVVEGFPKSRVFTISDWSRFPYYECDFGWGKPIWVASVAQMDTAACLLATRDGEGVEAWIGLPTEEMAKFEQHPDVLAFSSFN
ncbi:Vinorine synthase-like [Melia azedarach]|uniref:Vinorine synthase-like n=1 Tax=Melia azedarach TaxID=155640 RepID=A0ACC1WNK7_MELAZ|nr:Vinorine synthase-like [Melia azedarach]